MARKPKLKPVPTPIAELVMGGRAVHPLGTDPARQKWPRRLVFWDCEAEEQPGGGFSFTCAHARLYTRQPDYTYQPAAEALCHTPASLWDTIDGWSRHKEAMRLYAHNMTFDLGVAEWYQHLWWRLGYHGEPGRDIMVAASGEAPYLRLRRGPLRREGKRGSSGRSKLTFCDTISLFHCSVDQLAADLRLDGRPELADAEARCEWDTGVLAAAVLAYLERFRQLGVSPQAPTGTGNGFAILRTLHLEPGSVIHHLDERLYEAEADSRYGGRREAWRHGAVDGPLEEWDYEHAHATLCLEPVPCKVRDPLWALAAPSLHTTTLQEWIVATDVPCVPYRRDDGSVIYPTGRFPATLWGPEAALALDYGARLEPGGRRWEYETAPVLRAWAEWILAELETTTDPLWLRCCKSWSHTMVGKWGQANSDYQPVGETWPSEWQLGRAFEEASCVGHPSGYTRLVFSEAGVWGVRDEARPAEHANYALQSYVMAMTRVRLWRAIMAAGPAEVIHVNGDGLIVTRRGGNRLRQAGQLRAEGLRRKQVYRKGVDVWNAQAVIDRDPASVAHKVAGLPRGSERLGPTTWATETWRQSLLDGPVRRSGVWTLPPGPLGRVRAADGRTAPYRVAR